MEKIKKEAKPPLFRSCPSYETACSVCLLATQHTVLQDVRAWAKSDTAMIQTFFQFAASFLKNLLKSIESTSLK